MKSPKQEEAFDILSRKDKLTVSQVAKEMDVAVKAAGAHLRRLEQAGRIHVSEWRKNEYHVMTKCYSVGFGESVVHVSQRKQKPPKEPKQKKEPAEDVNVYQTKNNSRIVSQDNRLSHADHIRFMNSFRPQPDYAATWLFNQPAVELLGARYD